MRDFPSGAVTFVFTDIEGSTRLLRELGDGYRFALAAQREVIRGEFTRRGGLEVDNQGDAFFFVFRGARDAIAAASAAQAALERTPTKVRMGVHTGSPTRSSDGYTGLDVHLGARISAAGHGGQVLLSSATRDLVSDIDLVDLGRHRVKDFDEPVWIFQLGDQQFPPLKTISNTNLPHPTSSFFGRDREIAEIVGTLRDSRLVTLTGPGGTGKTRLAIAAAAELVVDYRHGVFWVDLASIRDPALVTPAIAQVIGAHGDLAAEIGDKSVLLVLDNLEQVVGAAPEVAQLTEACPNLGVLVTSRERMNVRGEADYEVGALAAQDAVEFFCSRSHLAPSTAISELCRRLDNSPLALELAAARARALSPEHILERLGQRLDLFKGTRDAAPRQSSLRATLAWSYELLSSEEKVTFSRLGVFDGGCTVAAAEEVCATEIDILQLLVDKSLLRHSSERYSMLETIREFAVELLAESDDRDGVRDRHARWIADWGKRLDVRGVHQDAALRSLRSEMPNVRVALERFALIGRAAEALALASALAQGMFHIGATAESAAWLDQALTRCLACPPDIRARGLLSAAIQSTFAGHVERGVALAEEASALTTDTADLELKSDVLLALGVAEHARLNFAAAKRYTEDALLVAEELGDRSRIGDLRNNLCYFAIAAGDLAFARVVAEQDLPGAMARQDFHNAATLLHNLALISILGGATDDGQRALLEALTLCRDHGFASLMSHCVDAVAILAQRRGDIELAAVLIGATNAAERDVGPIESDLRNQADRATRLSLASPRYRELAAAGSAMTMDAAAERAAEFLRR